MSLAYTVICGSVRETRIGSRDGRMGLRVSRMVCQELEKQGHKVNFIDLKDLNLPMLKYTFAEYDDLIDEDIPESYQTAWDQIKKADGVIFISAEYNHNMPPALKNFIDHLSMGDLSQKMAAVVAYSIGPFGGCRAVPALKESLTVLGAISLPDVLLLPTVEKAIEEDGKIKDEKLENRLKKFLNKAHWLAEALKNHRN